MQKVAMLVLTLTPLLACQVSAAEDIAICGSSGGYAYHPAAGLVGLKQRSGDWADDAIVAGKFTLTRIAENEFDLLVSDATGRVSSARQDGAQIELFGIPSEDAISIIVDYGKVVETYTFLRNVKGEAEAMWTSNKGGGALIMKVGAYQADCSYFVY